MLLLERADFPEHWQSVTGSQEPGESLAATAHRELAEETGIDADRYGGVTDWNMHNDFEIFPQWAHRYAPGVTHNTEHVFGLLVPARVPVSARSARARAVRVAAVAASRRPLLLLDQPSGDRSASCARRRAAREIAMTSVVRLAAAIAAATLACISPVHAQESPPPAGAGGDGIGSRHRHRGQRPHRRVAARGSRQSRSRARGGRREWQDRQGARAHQGQRRRRRQDVRAIRRTRSPTRTSRRAGASRSRSISKARTSPRWRAS